jgi:hypothetical protein
MGQDPGGKFVHLASVEWFLSYSSAFQIVGGQVQAIAKLGGLRFNPVQRGAHPNAPTALQPPIANDMANNALKISFLPGSPFRFDGLFYPPSAPDNFIFELNPKKS